MSEQATEQKPAAATTTPPPVAGQSGESAPAQTQAAPTTEQPKPQEQTKPQTPSDFFRQREGKREKKATERVAELERELAKSKATPAAPSEPEAPSLIDEPEKWAASVIEKAKRETFAALEVRQKEQEADARFVKSAETATDWLRTRSHLKEDANLAKEVFETIKAKYSDIGGINPEAAARLAYDDVCAAKGIVPDAAGYKPGGLEAQGGTASGGVRQSAPAAGGKRVFQKGTVEAYIFEAKPGTAEYSKRLAEVEEAHREGRIR